MNTRQSGTQKATSLLSAVETLHQNFNDVPERQSARDIDGRGDSKVQKGPDTAAGTSNLGNNSNESASETLTLPATVIEQDSRDHIDGAALQREADSALDINSEQNVHTSVQQALPPILDNVGSPLVASQTPFIGPFSTGRTGAAQFQKYW
ncbi:MAG: hypothetical protein ACMZI0_03650 [Symbiopectobacterium sp.]|uniref:hypothetical protein n=1 Tax=Symbiopectobacterium sp. TaxID=2952789 RepID=UPI0039E82606